MPFERGQPVWVRTLGREGIVQKGLRSGKAYLVLVEGVVVRCPEEDLEAPSRKKKKGKKYKPLSAYYGQHAGSPSYGKAARSAPSIDLHGMRVEEALRAVEKAINHAIMDDHDYLEIIHGRGTGRVREAVHRYLTECQVVAHFELLEWNPGVTRAYF